MSENKREISVFSIERQLIFFLAIRKKIDIIIANILSSRDLSPERRKEILHYYHSRYDKKSEI